MKARTGSKAPAKAAKKKPATRAKSGASSQSSSASALETKAKLEAIDRAQAIIEFDLDGTILFANANFLGTMGYHLDEVVGKHHSMFAEPAYAKSDEYRTFWRRLNEGHIESGEYRRLGKGGREVWIQASYNPVLDGNGRPFKVIKFATDVTAQKLRNADFEGQLAAISKSQAVIEFRIDGTILTANENFLSALGYRLDEIQGKHHSLFVEPAHARSDEYRDFWRRLNDGRYEAGEYKRVAKGGREVWIQASYNPILDTSGRPYKVVKFATDITTQKLRNADFEGQLAAISKSQAVIEFTMEGNVITANENFLNVMGYSLEEVKGKHHRMFVDNAFSRSEDYRDFWRRLNDGQYDSGEYKRVGRGGREVWIQASYNPILDASGRPSKVVKYATDVTDRKTAIQDAMGVIEAMSRGDLTRTMASNATGEFSSLSQQLNSSVTKLRELVMRITASTDAITNAASDISEGNSNLNRRTQEQAAALEETSSSLDQITGTVKQNASNASQANQLASGACKAAEQGGQVVGAAVKAMQAITDSSKKVAEIISVIEQIAFQTNMLALNAAVEAARAGDQGRGFAVVAAEVRNLAQRSATAAQEIKSLIQDSADKVEQGAQLVYQSGETLQTIVASVKRVESIIGEISAAGEEQATGIDQINIAVSKMEKGTQQNAAMVEEAASAAESMRGQAGDLLQLVRFFDVGGTAALVAPPPAVMARPAAAASTPAAARARQAPPVDNDWKEF